MSKRWRDERNEKKFRQIDRRYPLTGGGNGGGDGGSIAFGLLIGLVIVVAIIFKLFVGAGRLLWNAFSSRR